MQRREVGVRGVEEYVTKLQSECKGKREQRGQGRICRKIVHLRMRKKIEDQSDIVREKRYAKNELREKECELLGGKKTSKYRRKGCQ